MASDRQRKDGEERDNGDDSDDGPSLDSILESILDLWPANRLGVADRGIREGILRSLMAGDFASVQNAGKD